MTSALDKKRREEFRTIKRGLGEFKRRASAFPTNEELKLFEQCFLGGESNEDLLLLFQIWAHPHPRLDDAIQMASRVSRWNCARSGEILNGMVRIQESPKVDILGGAAPALRDFFYPNVFVERECADGRYVERFMRDIHPMRIVHGLSTWLGLTAYPNPQLLWPHRLNWIWRIDPWDLDERSLDDFQHLMNTVVNFIPPCGLLGDDLPHYKVVEQLSQEFESRKSELPPPLADGWERAQTRAGRASRWEPYRFPDDELSTIGDDGLVPYVTHDSEIEAPHFHLIVSIFEELDVLDSAEPVREVDAGKLLHEKMIARLGYSKGEPVPGHVMRLQMNADFVDSDTARIDLDILRLWPHRERRAKQDVPTMVWITRPEKHWPSVPTLKPYRSLARRAFEDRAGIPLYVYSSLGDGNIKRAADIDGSVHNPGHYPLASTKYPLLDDPAFDCPPWQGDPLPPFE